MPEDLTVLDGLLKDVYTDVIRDHVATFDPVQEMIEKVSDFEWDGRQVIEAAIMSYNEGVGAIGEDKEIPTPGNFDPQQHQIPMRYVYGAVQFTKQIMESAKRSRGSFKNATRTSMDTLVRNLKREKARMLWGYGQGDLAHASGANSGATVPVDNPGGVTGTVGGARFIRKGMIVAIFNAAGDTLKGAKQVTAVAADGSSITLSAAVTTADGDRIVRASKLDTTDPGNTAIAKEPMGILGLMDDGTYLATLHGLSRATYPQLKSHVKSATGALSLDGLQQVFDIVDQRADAEITALATHHAVRRKYLELLEADRRYTGEFLQAPDGGTKAVKRGGYITFGGLPVIPSKYAPFQTLFFVDKRDLVRYAQIDGEWADEGGAILRQVGNRDTWTAFYRYFENYHLRRPATCARMDGITANTVYVAQW